MRLSRSGNATQIVALFLTRSFLPGETIALLIRRRSPLPTLQRIVPLERALEPRYLGWLAYENEDGANIHVGANPLHARSRKRSKDSIARVQHLYLDLDTDGEARLALLQTSDRVPPLNAIVSTSPGKYQVLWRVEGFSCEQQEATLKGLALAFGGDRACTDCNRVLRLPGFLNWKYDPPYRVSAQYLGNTTWHAEDFRLDLSHPKVKVSFSRFRPQSGANKPTNSEQDWAWVLAELARGTDAHRLTRSLAERRSDKRTPLYYAQRTVDVASARLWLAEGIAIEHVITMLERRRCSEIPSGFARMRAREIAHTAERMMGRTESRIDAANQHRDDPA
jgi:hypothetical protein